MNKNKEVGLKKERILQLLRYAIVGGLAIGIYHIILYGLTEYFKVPYLISATAATIISFLINFILHKFWTFNNYDIQAVPKQLSWYTLMKITLAVTNIILLYCLVDYLKLYYLIASGIVTVFISVVSFILTHKIFHK